MLKRMVLTWMAIGLTFHKWAGPLFTMLNLLIHNLFVTVAMKLDPLFFPSLRKITVKRPIVIVGNPRSGTTFLHRFLANNGIGVGMPVWKMLYPSLIQQKIVRPLLPLMERFSPTRFHSRAAHATNLTSIETDDPCTLFRYFDGFFLYGFFLAWAEDDPIEMFAPEARDTSGRDLKWYQEIWRRNLVGENQSQVLAKLFSLGIRMPQFMAFYPEAKVLYMIRDPRSTVPSGMSLVTGVLDQRFGFWKLPEEKRQRYLERLYRAFLDLSLRFHDDYVADKCPGVMIVHYHRMMQDFEGLMRDVLQFLEVKPSETLQSTIKINSEKQRQYKSEHKYDLSKFGLTEERILKDYEKIYRTFGIPV